MRTVFLYLRALGLLLLFVYLAAFFSYAVLEICARPFDSWIDNSGRWERPAQEVEFGAWWKKKLQLMNLAVFLAAGGIAYFYIWSLSQWRKGERKFRPYIYAGILSIAMGTIYTAFSPLIWALYIVAGFLMSAGFIVSFSWLENRLARRCGTMDSGSSPE